jgi:hypothetical protein
MGNMYYIPLEKYAKTKPKKDQIEEITLKLHLLKCPLYKKQCVKK